MQTCDLLIIGGGIVGLATAFQHQQRYPKQRIIVLEKEAAVAHHQSGNNSGVLHSGIYYAPGSQKARYCREGKAEMEVFCTVEGIPFQLCGKVIVAVTETERPQLHKIYARGQANGINCTLISAERLREIEPHAAGVEALHVPEAGIVGYGQVAQRLAQRLQANGHSLQLNTAVTAIDERSDAVIVQTTRGDFSSRYLISCAGLHADRLARLAGEVPMAQILPFRGEYYTLAPAAKHLCRGLIYPVPDPSFPFLGVHFTRMITGGVECGPNAVLAFSREGYRLTQVNLRDLTETMGYPGFRALAAKYWRTGLAEMWRSASKKAFLRTLQRLVPDVKGEHLSPAPAGVRAQAVLPNGSLMDDFAFQESGRVLHVINAPSPAATASLRLGRAISERLATRF